MWVYAPHIPSRSSLMSRCKDMYRIGIVNTTVSVVLGKKHRVITTGRLGQVVLKIEYCLNLGAFAAVSTDVQSGTKWNLQVTTSAVFAFHLNNFHQVDRYLSRSFRVTEAFAAETRQALHLLVGRS